MIIRWNVQHGVVVIPKSVTPHRIEENLNVFDFELSDAQMEKIDSLNKDERMGPQIPPSITGINNNDYKSTLIHVSECFYYGLLK